MVSNCLTWDQATKPFFVNGCGVKVNLQTYNDIYRRNFYLPFNLFMYVKAGFLYNTMYHHTVQTLYKIFYKKYSIHVLSKHMDVPLPLPIPLVTYCNPLSSYIWNKMKIKVHKNRLNKPFENENELKKHMKNVWKDIAFN